MKQVLKNGKIFEHICLVLFVVFSVTMCFFHEPWYDEIQAYMVASDASLYDMIFVLPHYEGHPPIWTLLLAVFAKTGVPIEVGLRIPTLFFATLATFFVIYKAPFPKIVRCTIPFTYFLFYQYTIICRPYSMMYLGFVLAAYFYKERNQKPVQYLASLFLLCVSSAYGIMFAGVFCLIWTVEIIKELIANKKMKMAYRDKRTWALTVMLVMAVSLLAVIWPADNAFAQTRVVEFSKLKCLIYTFLVLPADALISDVSFMGRLQQFDTIIKADYTIILCIFLSLIIIFVLIVALHILRKKALLIFPYFAFATYAALGYFYNHHIGIVPLFLLFVFWSAVAERPKEIRLPGFLIKIEKQIPNFARKTAVFFVGLILSVSVFWTIIAVVNDIKYPVWYAKDLAAFIEEYDLDEYKVVNQWTYQLKDEMPGADMQSEYGDNVLSTEIAQLDAEDYYQYVKMCNFVDVLAYHENEENYIYNFNGGDDNNRYVNHDMLSEDETYIYLKELGEKGYPEIIIGEPEIIGMIDLDVEEHAYLPIYCFSCYRINKYNKIYASSFVYARDDIYASRDDWPIYEQMVEISK